MARYGVYSGYADTGGTVKLEHPEVRDDGEGVRPEMLVASSGPS